MKDNKKTAVCVIFVTWIMSFLLFHKVTWQAFMALSKIPNILQQPNLQDGGKAWTDVSQQVTKL